MSRHSLHPIAPHHEAQIRIPTREPTDHTPSKISNRFGFKRAYSKAIFIPTAPKSSLSLVAPSSLRHQKLFKQLNLHARSKSTRIGLTVRYNLNLFSIFLSLTNSQTSSSLELFLNLGFISRHRHSYIHLL